MAARFEPLARTARLQVHGEQQRLAPRAGKHQQLRAAPQGIMQREVDHVGPATEGQPRSDGKARVLQFVARGETE